MHSWHLFNWQVHLPTLPPPPKAVSYYAAQADLELNILLSIRNTGKYQRPISWHSTSTWVFSDSGVYERMAALLGCPNSYQFLTSRISMCGRWAVKRLQLGSSEGSSSLPSVVPYFSSITQDQGAMSHTWCQVTSLHLDWTIPVTKELWELT